MQNYEFLTLNYEASQLHGLKTGGEQRLAIHIHGTWGNFYENPFAIELSKTYTNSGWSYASVNTTGHDGGSVHEHFDDSLRQISVWVDRLCPPGRKVIMQGHSLGALKILRLLQDPDFQDLKSRVAGVVLLSPFDLVAFNGGTGTQLEERRVKAQELRALTGGATLTTPDIFNAWLLSVDTFLEATDSGGRWDLLPSREKNIGRLGALGVPTFVALGSEDFASYPDARAAAKMISNQAPEVSLTFIEGAPHNFAGYENLLAEGISEFIKSL